MGSVLIGSKDFIHKARRVRKVLGGGMRQVGMVAAAGLYALENNIDRLKNDHVNAEIIGNALANCSWVQSVMPVETNIVVAHLHSKFDNLKFVEKLKRKGILSIPFGKGRVRMVTHLDISNKEIEKVVDSIKF